MHRTKLDEWCMANKMLVHPSWEAKLFSRPYDEIVKYIKNRFETTLVSLSIIFAWQILRNALKVISCMCILKIRHNIRIV